MQILNGLQRIILKKTGITIASTTGVFLGYILLNTHIICRQCCCTTGLLGLLPILHHLCTQQIKEIRVQSDDKPEGVNKTLLQKYVL